MFFVLLYYIHPEIIRSSWLQKSIRETDKVNIIVNLCPTNNADAYDEPRSVGRRNKTRKPNVLFDVDGSFLLAIDRKSTRLPISAVRDRVRAWSIDRYRMERLSGNTLQ